MRTITGMQELVQARGEEIGVTEWQEVAQEDIDAFARTTGDTYWIHTDPERAKDGPMGSTIAHGLYTLALGPAGNDALVAFEGFRMRMNYGYDKVRFPAPVPVGSRVRMRLTIADVRESDGGGQAVFRQTFEREGGDKPVCVADQVIYFMA